MKPSIVKVTNLITQEIIYYYFPRKLKPGKWTHGCIRLATPTTKGYVVSLNNLESENILPESHEPKEGYKHESITDIELYRLIPHMSYPIYHDIFKNYIPVFHTWKNYRNLITKYKIYKTRA